MNCYNETDTLDIIDYLDDEWKIAKPRNKRVKKSIYSLNKRSKIVDHKDKIVLCDRKKVENPWFKTNELKAIEPNDNDRVNIYKVKLSNDAILDLEKQRFISSLYEMTKDMFNTIFTSLYSVNISTTELDKISKKISIRHINTVMNKSSHHFKENLMYNKRANYKSLFLDIKYQLEKKIRNLSDESISTVNEYIKGIIARVNFYNDNKSNFINTGNDIYCYMSPNKRNNTFTFSIDELSYSIPRNDVVRALKLFSSASEVVSLVLKNTIMTFGKDQSNYLEFKASVMQFLKERYNCKYSAFASVFSDQFNKMHSHADKTVMMGSSLYEFDYLSFGRCNNRVIFVMMDSMNISYYSTVKRMVELCKNAKRQNKKIRFFYVHSETWCKAQTSTATSMILESEFCNTSFTVTSSKIPTKNHKRNYLVMPKLRVFIMDQGYPKLTSYEINILKQKFNR